MSNIYSFTYMYVFTHSGLESIFDVSRSANVRKITQYKNFTSGCRMSLKFNE